MNGWILAVFSGSSGSLFAEEYSRKDDGTLVCSKLCAEVVSAEEERSEGPSQFRQALINRCRSFFSELLNAANHIVPIPSTSPHPPPPLHPEPFPRAQSR